MVGFTPYILKFDMLKFDEFVLYTTMKNVLIIPLNIQYVFLWEKKEVKIR